MERYTEFKAVTDFSHSLLSEEIEQNLKWWSRWAFLRAGAWTDVNIPSSGFYGGRFDQLTPVDDANYSSGQVWETPKKEICYESGVNFNDSYNPIQISGVWVTGVLHGTGSPLYGHYVDYENGHVVFNSGIDTDLSISMNHSYRSVSVQIADDSPIWREIQYGSLRVDDNDSTNPNTGEWAAVPALRRQQLPAVIIELVPRTSNRGYELGSTVLITEQDVLFHCVAEDRATRNRLIDCYRFEQDHVIWLFNTDDIVESTDWPLDYRGAKNLAGLMYPDLIDNYQWQRLRFIRTTCSEMESPTPRLHFGTVRATVEVVFGCDV